QTVWKQINAWVDNLELAFPSEALSLQQWLPILEAALSQLTVGLIPQSLDRVFVGAVDRSRNPDIKLALVLGLNDTVFPARPEHGPLLSETDRLELERHNVRLGSTRRDQMGREHFFGYIACTRSSERLVLTYACHDSHGAPLNPSPFVSQIQELFPTLKVDSI